MVLASHESPLSPHLQDRKSGLQQVSVNEHDANVITIRSPPKTGRLIVVRARILPWVSRIQASKAVSRFYFHEEYARERGVASYRKASLELAALLLALVREGVLEEEQLLSAARRRMMASAEASALATVTAIEN